MLFRSKTDLGRLGLTTLNLLAVVALSLVLTGLYGQDSTVYRGTGMLMDGDAGRKELTIRHQAIGGYMPAMTMPFPVRDWDALPGDLYTGDSVAFELVVLPEAVYIRSLEILQPNPLAPRFTPGGQALQPGETFPDGAFTDLYGRPFRLASSAPALRFISFIFTRCPMPTMCPLVDQKHASLAKVFAKRNVESDRLLFISLSFDYVYDTPAVLRDHYGRRTSPGGNWTVLSAVGHEKDLRAAAVAAGVEFWGIEEGAISHTMNSVLIDGQGKVVQVFFGSDWDLQSAQDVIFSTLQEGR